MLRTFFFALLLSLPLLGQAQTGNLAWQHAYGTAVDETQGLAVAMPAGGYMLLGRQPWFFGQYSQLYFVRTNAQGDTLWTKTVLVPNCNQAFPNGLAVDAASNLIVTVSEFASGTPAVPGFALKLTPLCDTIWTRRYAPTLVIGGRGGTCGIGRPTVMADGNYAFLRVEVVTTPTFTSQNTSSLFKLNAANGNLMWSADLNSHFTALGLDASVINVNGFGYSSGSFLFLFSGRYSVGVLASGVLSISSSGTLTRARKRLGPGMADSFPVFAATADGNFIAARRQHILKLTPAGDTLWHTTPPSRYPFRTWDAAAVVEDASGSLLVAANSQLAPPNQTPFASNVHLVRFSRRGALLNDTLLYRGGDTYARAAVLGPNGRDLVFSGYTTNGVFGGSDLLMAKYTGFRPLATGPGAALAPVRLGLYPNPAAPGAPVQAELPDRRGGTLVVFDALGRAVGRQAVPPGTGLVAVPAVAGLPAGVYVLRFERADGSHSTGRLLRE